MNTGEQSGVFGKLRSFFWPVYRHEIGIFIPMLLIFFFISLNYNILRTAKDSLILTAAFSGAETIPFLKTWVVLPMSMLSMVVFTRLSNKFSMEKVFYFMMGSFLIFFLLFALAIYPMHEGLHAHTLADKLETMLPVGLHGLVTVFRNWTFTIFYVMAELWSTAIMTVLFWGFANEVTSVSGAKRFYALLALAGNLATIFSGEITSLICKAGISVNQTTGRDGWGHSLILISLVVCVVGALTMGVFRWLNLYVRRKDLVKADSPFRFQQNSSTDIKMGVRKSFGYLMRSKYLICIAVLVIAYNLTINLTEVVWKDQLSQLYTDPNKINAYLGKVNEAIGFTSTIMALLCGFFLRRFSWSVAAMVPAIILLITGTSFFSLILFKDIGIAGAVSFISNPLILIVLFGSLANVFSRASKYTFFDNTKELAFIPLSKESRLKGKAAIDGVGSRIGKSGGAVIYQMLLFFLGTISAAIPFVAIALIVVIVAWVWAIKVLGKQFKELMAKPAEEKIPVPSEETPALLNPETPQQ